MLNVLLEKPSNYFNILKSSEILKTSRNTPHI